jgi:tetratricopeptide (TPR) repeat protein
VAAALLSKVRAELTSQQAQIVDTLKRQCLHGANWFLVFALSCGRASRPPCIAGWSRHERQVSIRWFVLCYYNRGVAKGAKGDLDGAIADYSKAIELKPDYAEPYNNRGIVKGAKEDRWHLQFDSTSAARLLWLVTATLAELALELELASSRALAPART